MKHAALVLLVAFVASAAANAADPSLERARLLNTNKLYDEAKRELVAIAVSAAPDEDKAEALNLLGDIAVDQGNERPHVQGRAGSGCLRPAAEERRRGELPTLSVVELGLRKGLLTTAPDLGSYSAP